jgi:hypothetical protein
MSAIENILDEITGNTEGLGDDLPGLMGRSAETGPIPSWSEPGYEGSIDYRIRQLSYSSLLTLHSCPRKFQLYRLRTQHKTAEALKTTITFAFGHVVGDGIQKVFQGLSEDEIIWDMFLGWHTPRVSGMQMRRHANPSLKRFWQSRNSLLSGSKDSLQTMKS